MSRIAKLLSLSLLVFALAVAPAAADMHATGYVGDFLKDFDAASKKLVDLAEAIPADKYGWAPAEGIRSVSETFVHVAAGNFFFASQFGVAMPEGFSRDAEQTVTSKADVVALLKVSLDHIHQAAKAAAGKLDEEVDFFGSQRTRRGILMIAAGHAHEHLGQAIAYARSNGVAPPWSGDGGDGGDG